ncbi:hypothetical protein EBR44_07540 [bacterium]|nr:hypothetical protein [bacterium]
MKRTPPAVAAVAKRPPLTHAFDEMRFGAARTLDLRTSMPTAEQAVQRLDPWMRQKQVEKAGDVLVITGRGNGSPGGVAVVRDAVRKALTQLKRKRVVAEVQEHTPGSYVVTLERTAALFEAGKRTRDTEPAPRVAMAEVRGLDLHTVRMLRALAARALDALGAPRSERFMADEFRRQFSVLSAAIPADAPDREARLREIVAAALDAYDDAE